MRVCILIPTYNEKENIARLLRQLIRLTSRLRDHKFSILIVDSGSPDGTSQIVKSFCLEHQNIHLLLDRREGLGRSMVRGYRYALKNLGPDVIVTNEADFGFDFKHLPMMLKKIESGYDVVVASRHVGGGRSDGWTFSRRLNHWIANTFFASFVAGVKVVRDKNGAFRAIKVKGALDRIKFSRYPMRGFGFFFYQIYDLQRIGAKFFEFPAIFTFRTRGESKVSFNPRYLKTYVRDVLEYVWLAFQIRLKECRLI